MGPASMRLDALKVRHRPAAVGVGQDLNAAHGARLERVKAAHRPAPASTTGHAAPRIAGRLKELRAGTG